MFRRSPIADIYDVVTAVPVDIDRLILPGEVDSDKNDDGLSYAERRYRKAIIVARRRLIAEAPIRATADPYLIDLVNHHARTIMMPPHVVLAAVADGVTALALAERFAVPLDVVAMRLRDSDIRPLPGR